MNTPNPHRLERDYLLYLARTAPEPKGRAAAGITEADYAAVYTSPANLPPCPYRDKLRSPSSKKELPYYLGHCS